LQSRQRRIRFGHDADISCNYHSLCWIIVWHFLYYRYYCHRSDKSQTCVVLSLQRFNNLYLQQTLSVLRCESVLLWCFRNVHQRASLSVDLFDSSIGKQKVLSGHDYSSDWQNNLFLNKD
jgi:hypothetical protein